MFRKWQLPFPNFMKMHVIFCEVGLGVVNSNLAKELARFLNYFENREISNTLLLFDHRVIKKTDLETQPYLKEEVGFYKCGVMASILNTAYSKLPVIGIQSINSKRKLHSYIQRFSHSIRRKNIVCFIVDTNDIRSNEITLSQFQEEETAIYIAVSRKKINVGFRFDGNTVKEPTQIEHSVTDFLHALTAVHLIMARISQFLVSGKIALQSLSLEDYRIGNSDCWIRKLEKPKNLIIACVGAGGTGGCFYKELIRYTNTVNQFFYCSIILIDGDSVEEKNQIRQPFMKEDIRKKKAVVLHNMAQDNINKNHRLFVYPYYLETVNDLKESIQPAYRADMENELYLIGAVDNHRARQVLHEYFIESDTLVYIDSANEYSEGEIVVSRKQEGKVIAPPRAFYFPDVLTDQTPSASELSCGALNFSDPQHMVTNLTAGHMTLRCLDREIRYVGNRGGILYFDALDCFSRYQSIPKEVEKKCNLKHY